MVTCDKCKRLVPRDKAVEISKGMRFDLGEQQDVVLDLTGRVVHYCVSCGKHLKIYEKKKKMLARRRQRREE